MTGHITGVNPNTIKERVTEKLRENPELMYHIDNPFLEKYIDIIVEALCEEISAAIYKSVSQVEKNLNSLCSRF